MSNKLIKTKKKSVIYICNITLQIYIPIIDTFYHRRLRVIENY